MKAVDGWIPFDRYLLINTPYNGTPFLPYFAPVSGNRFVCKGPDFLLKAYANALAASQSFAAQGALPKRFIDPPRRIIRRIIAAPACSHTQGRERT